MRRKKDIGKHWLLLPLFIILSIILYYGTIGRSFSSDDFLVLRRVGLDGKLLIRGFFRPLSDLTLYFNYLLGGFNPTGYYLFSIVLHGTNSFLLFLFCRQWAWTDNQTLQKRYALIAGILFLCYPFHNECIVWTLGRASGIAGSFGILSLVFLVGNLTEKLRIFLVCLCYFIGLTAYESIMMLPVLVLIILYKRGADRKRTYINWTTAMAITLILHVIIRIEVSGALAGPYGQGFFNPQLLQYAGNIFKVSGRLFLPPIESSPVFVVLSAAVLLAVLLLLRIVFNDRRINRTYLLKIILILSATSTIPVLSAISTKTSESDRFLYFPSFFFCACLSFALVNLIGNRRIFALSILFLCSYSIFFLEKNNANWKKASAITKDIIKTIGAQKNQNKIYLINLPDEFNGAFIFRLGLKEALVINNIDTSGLVIVNHLSREQMRSLAPVIQPKTTQLQINIPPLVTINTTGGVTDTLWKNGNQIYITPAKGNTILYWNNQRLLKLE